ncbi:3-isopropylmalate dehydratase small subunit [Fodinicurvata fenggangensis]|uniref:3-isopropylmalate dehydratase small subunit n=1 Tax=Fodinicurvata fenggangensis TaxID=1121830 RepID=UPI00047D0001|nr:3-isopropylmalate dehydratase small subunit [Fodinicurvata fenggangensis]
MQRFHKHRGLVAAMPLANVDTDQIIPARYLHRPREQGFGDVLFADMSFKESIQVGIDDSQGEEVYSNATILVTGENFGCGSSREHAVWALMDAGFQVVIAPSFGDIFFGNALKNGLLAIKVSEKFTEKLFSEAKSQKDLIINVDLPTQIIEFERSKIEFNIDSFWKYALIEGLSETALTMQLENEIRAFEAKHANHAPWLQNLPKGTEE